MQTSHYSLRGANAPASSSWYATGKRLGGIVANALDAFGVPTAPESGARPGGEIGRYFQFAPSVQVMSSGFVWHSDQETPETISTTGIEAVTRAYAKIVTDVNSTDIKTLRATQSTHERHEGGRETFPAPSSALSAELVLRRPVSEPSAAPRDPDGRSNTGCPCRGCSTSGAGCRGSQSRRRDRRGD